MAMGPLVMITIYILISHNHSRRSVNGKSNKSDIKTGKPDQGIRE